VGELLRPAARYRERNPQAIYARSSPDDVMLTYDYGAKHRAAVYTIVSAQQAGRD
jgi:hypothetical protein